MASTLLPPDANLEAYAHCCTASQVREHLTSTRREWLQTHGHIAVARSMEFNKDPLGVMGVILEQPEIPVNQPEFGGEEGNTLLHLAVSMYNEDWNTENLKDSVLLILSRNDLDPNVGNSKGDTPLHSAARASSLPCVAILLDDPRVNVAAVNYDKQTCLHVACDVDSSLKETSDPTACRIIKSATSRVKSIPQFLGKQDRFGNTGLHYAAARGLEKVVDGFLKAEGFGNKHELAMKKNHQGNLAIHLAAKNGHHGVVERMRMLVDDSQVDNVVVNIKDLDGRGLLHHAVRSGRKEILQVCIQRLSRPTFDLYEDLLAVATKKNIADFLLQKLDDEIVKNSKRKQDDYLANLLHFAVSEKLETVVGLIVKWYPKQAVVAMHKALEKENETIEALLRDHPEVQRDVQKMHKKYTYYVTAANAILVVSVLILTLTFGHCFTAVEAAQRRKDISELKEFGGPPGIKRVHWFDFILLPRWAFFQAMMATILAAFAALPFSFAFFFHEAVDDTKVKQLLYRTRVLIVSASYFLMLSLEALFFSFVCSQFLAPYIDYKCALACEVALSVFFLCATLFLGYNFVHYWRHRAKGDKQFKGPIKFMEMLKSMRDFSHARTRPEVELQAPSIRRNLDPAPGRLTA